jgi:hypothetical protein
MVKTIHLAVIPVGKLKKTSKPAAVRASEVPARTFAWDTNTKLASIPNWLNKLIPPGTDFDALDEVNQFDHVRFRVMHEIDIYEDEGPDETQMKPKNYRDAIKFMAATGGRLG